MLPVTAATLRIVLQVDPVTRHEDAEGEYVSFTLSLTSALGGNGWSTPRPGRYIPVPNGQKAGWASGAVWMDKENLGHIGIRTPNLHCNEGITPAAADYLVPGHSGELRHETNTIHASHSAESCDICGAPSGDVGYDNVSTGKQLPTFRSCCLQLLGLKRQQPPSKRR